MKAALILCGSGPILILTSFQSLEDPALADKLEARGIRRFIAHEIPVESVHDRYGARFTAITGDLSQSDDLRVIDIDGHHVFNSFSFGEWGPPIYSDRTARTAPAGSTETPAEGETVFVKVDSIGKVVDSTYLPFIGSRLEPMVTPIPEAADFSATFQIDEQGVIVGGSPASVNGRRLVQPGRISPALGRTEQVEPACTWRSDAGGGWT